MCFKSQKVERLIKKKEEKMNEFYFVVFVLIAASFWMYAIITAMKHQNSMGEKLVIILKK